MTDRADLRRSPRPAAKPTAGARWGWPLVALLLLAPVVRVYRQLTQTRRESGRWQAGSAVGRAHGELAAGSYRTPEADAGIEKETSASALGVAPSTPPREPIRYLPKEQPMISGLPAPTESAFGSGSRQELGGSNVTVGDRLASAAAWGVRVGWPAGVPIALLLAGVGLWASALGQIEPRRMTDLGLVSVFPPAVFAGLLLLTIGFCLAVHRRQTPGLVLLLYVVTLIIIVHGTPPLVFGTLRYAWAWKHLGIVDYIQRFGSVDPSIDAYHSWPGFFALIALGVQIAGVDSALAIATWAQPAFNLLFLGPLLLIMKAFTDDRRVHWLGAWFFFLFNWIGQDYFSPQAFAYLLHLAILGICLHWFGRVGSFPGSATVRWRVAAPIVVLLRRLVPGPLREAGPPAASSPPGQRIVMLLIVIALFAVIAASHQLTPFMTALAVTALVVAGRCSARGLPILMAIGTGTWVIFVATAFVNGHLSWVLASIFRPIDNLSARYVDLPAASPAMKFIAMVDSALAATVLLLAILGCLRRLRQGRLDLSAVVLLLAAVPVIAGNSYGGEMLFRVYFFALPFAAFFAAALLYPGPDVGRSWRTLGTAMVLSCVLLAGLLLAYYGKDRMNYFTKNELDAADYLTQTAPRGSFWLDGTWNWPRRYRNYEYYAYQSIMDLPKAERGRLYDDPVGVTVQLMQDSRYSEAYLTITRSQKMHVETTGVMPEGSLDRIEEALQQSERFSVVFRNDDATIFELRQTQRPGAP